MLSNRLCYIDIIRYNGAVDVEVGALAGLSVPRATCNKEMQKSKLQHNQSKSSRGTRRALAWVLLYWLECIEDSIKHLYCSWLFVGVLACACKIRYHCTHVGELPFRCVLLENARDTNHDVSRIKGSAAQFIDETSNFILLNVRLMRSHVKGTISQPFFAVFLRRTCDQ